jgi:monothiol glutaredoxin
LYLKGELLGGCDITMEMFRSGELRQTLEAAGVIGTAAA